MSDVICPLCGDAGSDLFFQDNRRPYLRCMVCRLVFVPARYHLSELLERHEYEQHQNKPDDQGYRRFLSRLCNPLLERLPKASRGLDFGCGPGPTLSKMLEEQGHSMSVYDKFFYPNEEVWQHRHDFICATEVVEHLRDPRSVLATLWAHIKPGGVLGLMTKLVIDREAFAHWHYKNDPTHICFYSLETMSWLAQQWSAELSVYGKDAFILTKPA